MTSRSDQPRLGASLSVLGTVLELRGQEAWDVMEGWTLGPQKAPGPAGGEVCTCGHSPESHVDGHDVCTYEAERPCWCNAFTAAPSGPAAADRSTERKQSARAAEHFGEHQADLDELDRITQRVLRRIDVACPPNTSEVKNRSTDDLDPVTPADAATAGWCASCWRNDQQMVPIDVNKKTGLRYFRDYCRWCGGVKATYGIEPPLDMLKMHHDGRRINAADMEAAVTAVKANEPKKKGKKKGRKWKAA